MKFFLTKPSLFRTRLIVLSEGKPSPDLCSSHLMADGPTWANFCDSSRVRTEIIRFLSISQVFVGWLKGALDLSLYQLGSPLG